MSMFMLKEWRSLAVIVSSFAVMCGGPIVAHAADDPTKAKAVAPFKILPPPVKVSEHVYAWIGPYGGPNFENKGYRMNMAFAVGKDAVAVFETSYTEEMAEEMVKHIAKITPLPIKYAINCNSQPDRFLGNEVFRRLGATIITHENEAKRMAQMAGDFVQQVERNLKLPQGSVRIPTPPNKIIKGDMEINLGDMPLKIRYFGPGHTPGPLVVHMPKDNVVYAGDSLYAGRLPAVIPGSNVKSWIKLFDSLRQFKTATFVPGHGLPARLSAFEFSTYQYLKVLNTHMAKMVEQGVDLDDAIKRLDQSKFSKLENFEDLAGPNASWTYLEREAEAFNK